MKKSIISFKLLQFFMCHDWKVKGSNLYQAVARLSFEEKELYDCDMSKTSHDWIKFYENYWLGIRKWALKEDLDNLIESRIRLNK